MPDENRQLRIIPVHRSLTRPQLMFGCERFLMLMLLMVVTILIFGALVRQSWLNFFCAIIVYYGGRQVLVYMAKKDPQMSEIHRRSVRYRHYYPAVSTVGSKAKVKAKRW